MSKPAAILDIDGTLVDTNYHHAIAWYRAFLQSGVTLPLWRIHRHIGMGGDQLVAALTDEDFDSEHGDDVRAAEKALYMALIDEVRPLEGARELVEDLARNDHAVVLASSAKPDEVEHYLDLLDVRELADAWTHSGDVERTKPQPDLVEAAVEKAGGGPAVMVGDSTWDCEAAGRAGIETIAVLTGGFSEAELREAGAAQVFGTLQRATRRNPEHFAGLKACAIGSLPVATARAGPRIAARRPSSMTPSTPERPAAATEAESPGLTRAEEDRRLLIRYHKQGDQAAREQLVQRLLPLARRMARRYRRSDEPLDDLVQVATLGLIKAIDRFDPARETAFSSYAVPTMLGELKRYFRDNGWAVHVPRGMQERVMQVDNAVKDLSRRIGRSPSVAEIGEMLDLSPEQVLEAMEAASAYDAVSLESYRFGDEGDGETYAESIGVDDERFELVEYCATIAPTLQALPPRDRIVLHLRFVEDLTQAEIAERVGVSQMHVSRLIRRALERLRTVADHAG